jgi:hypothetical protein
MQFSSTAEMDGLDSHIYLFHSENLYDTELFDSWNFTNRIMWDDPNVDSFWYINGTTQLFRTETFTIGQQQPERVLIELEPEKTIKVNRKVEGHFLGIANSFSDEISRKVIMSPSSDTNDMQMTDLASTYKSSTLMINFHFNFVERVFELKYFTYMDILSKIGGLQASLLVIIKFGAPMLSLWFLGELAKIIKNKVKTDFKVSLNNYLNLAKRQFKAIQESIDSGEIEGLDRGIVETVAKQLDKVLAAPCPTVEMSRVADQVAMAMTQLMESCDPMSKVLLEYQISPLKRQQNALELQAERSSMTVTTVLKTIRSRIGFYGLFVGLENGQLTRAHVQGQDQQIKELGAAVVGLMKTVKELKHK